MQPGLTVHGHSPPGNRRNKSMTAKSIVGAATLTSLALLLSAAYALASPMTSGRPAAVLKDSQCHEVWSMKGMKNDTLSQNDAVPYIVNFWLTDADHNGQISKGEFDRACKKGLVQYTNH
jgi:hypothetical protein